MMGVQVAWYGLFLILLQMSTMIFADLMLLVGTTTLFIKDDPEVGFKLFAFGGIALLISLALGGLGKILCLGAPEEGARKLIVMSLLLDVGVLALRVLWVTGQFSFPFEGVLIYFMSLGSYVLFLAFLARMGDNIGADQVGRYITVIYGLFGSGFVIPVVFFINWKVALLLLGIEIMISLLLYTYTIYTLFRAMPLYIEEVKLGYTDPTESAEDRKKNERKERLEGLKKNPSKGKVAEVPKGTPPEGALLYRVPKSLGPMLLAVKEGDRLKFEERTVGHGDDPREKIRHGLTAMHIAASCGVMEMADALLSAGVPVDEPSEHGLTPLFMAVQTSNPYLVGLFLKRGANIHYRNDDGLTPLHWACCAPHPQLEGASRIKMVEVLLDQGADMTMKTKDGKTPKDLAIDNELHELVSYLDRREGIAPPSGKFQDAEEEEGGTPDMIVGKSGSFKNFAGTHLAVLPPNLPELHAAVKDGDPEKVETQIARGVSVKEKVEGGMTPIHITAVTGVMSVSEMLFRYGATPNDTADYGLTPIFLALYVNNLNMVGYLISRGADLNHQDDMGRTPLHWAAAVVHPKLEGGNRAKVVKMLLEKGAKLNIKDKEGLTAQDLAEAAGHDEVIEVFKELAAAAASAANPTQSTDDDYY